MPAATTIEIRRQIVERRCKGEALSAIGRELGMSYNTVKKIWGHWRKYGKLAPNYEKAREKGKRKYQTVYEEAIEMKRQHPKWGGQLLRLELTTSYAEKDLPSVRTLQRWFKEAGVNRSATVRQSKRSVVKRGTTVHAVWAVDAKEQMQLADGTYACWLVATDEASGSILGSETFSPALLGTSASATSASLFSEDV